MADTNQALGSLIARARDASAAMPERHEAFAEIVRRFEHLVVACTYARLRDPALAEDSFLVRPDQRRQGLASAMLGSLLARRPGAAVGLVAPAAADVTAWLTSCGFVQVADRLLLERLLRKTVAIAPPLLDEYAGRYVVEARPGEPIVIERHGDGLISKSRDMRDLLLASSESEFFTRHHEGRGRFERDETGRVARLVISEGPRELIAIRRDPSSPTTTFGHA
jgi:GNAT superfamily N-acetyltransferase